MCMCVCVHVCVYVCVCVCTGAIDTEELQQALQLLGIEHTLEEVRKHTNTHTHTHTHKPTLRIRAPAQCGGARASAYRVRRTGVQTVPQSGCVSHVQVQELVDAVDVDGSRQLEFAEFQQILSMTVSSVQTIMLIRLSMTVVLCTRSHVCLRIVKALAWHASCVRGA